MARRTTQGRVNYEIKFTICSTMLLHSKEEQITMIGTRLLKTELVYNKGQDTITLN